MQITEIEIFKADLPLKRPFRIAIGETTVAGTVFVRIHTDQAIYGMGEANVFTPIVGETLSTALAAANDLARLLVGTDPLDIEGQVEKMQAFLPNNATIRSAFDMALFDIAGKAANMPLYQLLGGTKRKLETDNTIGIDTPETMVQDALDFKRRGFGAVKVKLGTTAAEDIERIRAIRAAVGPETKIRIDANQGWDKIGAIQVLSAIESFDIQYCEQPVPAWDFDGMAAVSAQSAIPIMADESLFDDHDAIKLVRANACGYFNIKLAKSSGLFVALKINAIAEAAGLKCMVGCMTETRLGLTAGAHLISARRNIIFADLDGALMLRDDPVVDGMVYGDGGSITLPDGPGLGTDLAADYLEALERTVISQNDSGKR
ncbi:MAG: dipeptide epimerase [Rhodobacteraceae bacterium]|jgi:L-Ala-D/L-Glu epimerase|nr:dipeptide epimerase [Paracoccaceae bacterium]